MSSKNYSDNEFLSSDFQFPDDRVVKIVKYLQGNPLVLISCLCTSLIAALFFFKDNSLYSSIAYLICILIFCVFITEFIKYNLLCKDYLSGLALIERFLLYVCVENDVRVIVLDSKEVELIGVCERLSTRYLLISYFPLENDNRFFIISSSFWSILKANKNILLEKKDRATYKNELEQFTKYIYNPDPHNFFN
ncbi:MAG: hypothetical protein JW737_10430 [Acidobacteria bacterium]|nr:hypothetical protein [Acidobacteriota bacterium]